MRTAIVTSLLLAGLPAISLGQSDLQKIGRILQGVQQLQQQQNQKNYSAPPQNGPYQYKMVPGNPNSSGNQNQGNFGPNNFFGPSGNGPGQVIYRSGASHLPKQPTTTNKYLSARDLPKWHVPEHRPGDSQSPASRNLSAGQHPASDSAQRYRQLWRHDGLFRPADCSGKNL
jgi:hypothetical protein